MSDAVLRSNLIRLASTMPTGSSERKALLDVLSFRGPEQASKTASSFWESQFKELDKVFSRWDGTKVRDWNKVMSHYRAAGLPNRDAGTPAHWYQEYRMGRLDLRAAAIQVAKELPNAERLLSVPQAVMAAEQQVDTAQLQERGESLVLVGKNIAKFGGKGNVRQVKVNVKTALMHLSDVLKALGDEQGAEVVAAAGTKIRLGG